MLTPTEIEVVVDTLSKRRAWCAKALKSGSLKPVEANTHSETLQSLDSAIAKLRQQGSAKAAGQESKVAALYQPENASVRGVALQSLTELNVLVIDDDPLSRELLCSFLSDMGVGEIDQACDGASALRMMRNAYPPYRMVLCDWNMPNMSGLQVFKSVRSESRFHNTFFTLVTSMCTNEKIKEAIQLGVNDYIVKPVQKEVLKSKLISAFGPFDSDLYLDAY